MKWLRRALLALVLVVFCVVAALLFWPATPAPPGTPAMKPQGVVSNVQPSVGMFETVVNAVTSSNIEGVVTLEGEPVENVQVELLGRKVTTSSKGEFAFQDVPRKTTLVVTAVHGDRVARAQVIVTGGKQFPLPLNLALVPGHRVKGRVLGPREERIAGATVECADLSERRGLFRGPRGMTLTFGSGAVEMGPLEALTASADDGTYDLRLTPGRWRCSAIKTGFSIASGVDLDLVGDQDLDHRLGDELTLTGDLSTSDGALVTDGRIEVLQSASAAHWLTLPSSRLDGQGRFSLRGLSAGEYDFEVYAGDRVTTLHHAVPPLAVHWTLANETILSVVVINSALGDMVMLQRPESPGGWTGTGLQNGKADFKGLEPGAYRLRLNQGSVEQQDQVTKEVQVVEGKTTIVELEAKATLQVSGVVVGPDGKGIATEVVLRRPPGARLSLRYAPPTRTDADGRFTVALAQGATMMLEAKPVAGLLAPEPIEVKSTDDKLLIRLTKSSTVRGQVVDVAGRPITRFTIDGAEHQNDEGRFEVPFVVQSRSSSNGVTRVSMTLSLRAGGFVPREHEVDQPTGDVDVGRLVLEQKRDVVVVVRGAKGQPLAGAMVIAVGAPTPPFREGTDVDGRFTLVDQPMAELKLLVSHPNAVTTPVTARAGETRVEVTLPAGLMVSGTVSGRQRVVVAQQGELIELTAVEKGAFAFHNLTPGPWRLRALTVSMEFASMDRARLPQEFQKGGSIEVTVGANGVTGVVVP